MTGMHDIEDFRVAVGKRVQLADFDPAFKGKHSKSHALRKTQELCATMSELQQKLFAERKRSLSFRRSVLPSVRCSFTPGPRENSSGTLRWWDFGR